MPGVFSNQTAPARGDAEVAIINDRLVNIRTSNANPLEPSTLYTTATVQLMDGTKLPVIVDEAKLAVFGVKVGSCVCIAGKPNEDDHVAIVKGVSVQGRLVVHRIGDPYCTFVPDDLVRTLVVLELEPGAKVASPSAVAAGPSSRTGGGGGATHSNSAAAASLGASQSWDPRYATLVDLEVLGQGAQGVVWKCRTTDGEVVVRKEMLFSNRDVELFHKRLAHARRVQSLSNPHLIRYLAVLTRQDPLRIIIVMPYFPESDLSKHLAAQIDKRAAFSPLTICSIVLQISTALAYLHAQSPPILHGDCKISNIAVFEGGARAVLMDLDTSKSSEDGRTYTSSVATMEVLAPEAVAGSATLLSDVFSLGLVFLQLAALLDSPMLELDGTPTLLSHKDWQSKRLSDAVKAVVLRASPTTPIAMIGLMCSMLSHDLAARPSAAQVCRTLEDIMEAILIG